MLRSHGIGGSQAGAKKKDVCAGVEISVRLSDQQGSQEEATGPCGCCLGSLGGEDARESPFSQPSPGQPHPKVLHTGLVLLLREKTECCEH